MCINVIYNNINNKNVTTRPISILIKEDKGSNLLNLVWMDVNVVL